MKILVVTQYYWPEDFRINDICKSFIEQGHKVEVLTGMPNYPEGKIYDGYSNLKVKTTIKDGIKIMRVPITSRGKNNSLKLGLNYLSFMITASIRALTLIHKRYDRIFVFQVSPITSAIPALILSKIKKIPSYIYIQDLWPETLYSIVNVSNKNIRNLMRKICNKIYNGFDNLLIASKGYEDILLNNNFKKEKIKYFPQWAEDFYSKVTAKDIDVPRDNFVVTFAGNIGKAQSVQTIIEAANLAKNYKNIQWNILGDGSEFENIRALVEKYDIKDTVNLLGRKPSTDMPKYFSKSDALIVTLGNEDILKVTLPAKVQSYMASGKPILAAISGEGNRILKESKCGLICESEDSYKLFENTITLYKMSKEEREKMGERGKNFFEDNFTRKKLLEELSIIMNLK